ncbi:hypothetical protein ACFX2C_000799 [Malus domestica]|uniref:Uncharacterized protein n=1 Tax=Malus domestica TaxID=3750 RepID=A0A498KMV2_MALDO|nr:hypothetical protein DVH24_009785 [Malus domestica]
MRSLPQPHRNGGNHPFTVLLQKLRRFNWNKQVCSGNECNNGATLSLQRSSTHGSISRDLVAEALLNHEASYKVVKIGLRPDASKHSYEDLFGSSSNGDLSLTQCHSGIQKKDMQIDGQHEMEEEELSGGSEQ